jgi:hypothetical protein
MISASQFIVSARRDCAAHDALQTRDRTKLRRTFPDRACDGPGSAHRFAPPRWQIMKPLMYALALRRIRDTAALSHLNTL